jgi:hypothetical protein
MLFWFQSIDERVEKQQQQQQKLYAQQKLNNFIVSYFFQKLV